MDACGRFTSELGDIIKECVIEEENSLEDNEKTFAVGEGRNIFIEMIKMINVV